MRELAPPIDEPQKRAIRMLALKRTGMAAATAFVAANIWTGCPLLALWVGSQAAGRQTLSMGAVGIVVVVLAVLVFAMALLLTWLNNVYDELTGRQRVERRSAWLRSIRAESERHVSQRSRITALERIVMINIYVAVVTLVVWYVFFASAPAPTLCTLHC
jgi:uncharacterized membrane protein (DUF485 family)